MNWIINEDITSTNKLRINFDPPNNVLTMFFANLKSIDFPNYLSQTIYSTGGFGVQNTSILFYDQMDWEDKEGINIREGDIYIYVYDGSANETIIREIDFNKILYDFSFKILKINNINFSEKWSENSYLLLKELEIKILKSEIISSNIYKKGMIYTFFDGMKIHNVNNQYDDWLSSSEYSVWSNSYIEINNKRIYFIKENVKVLSTFRFYNKEELVLLSRKYNLLIKEENGVFYSYSENHSARQFEISENDQLVVIYCLEGGNMPESIFIYGVFEK